MQIEQHVIDKIVREVISQLGEGAAKNTANTSSSSTQYAVFEEVETAIAAAEAAQKIWVNTPNKTKAKVIAALRQAMHDNTDEFARRAWQETGMGRLEDKIAKHHNAADATPGLEDLETRSWVGDNGTTVEQLAPYGVIAAITPSTHPIPVMLNSIIITIAPGNAVVFSVHPAAKNTSAYAIKIFERVIRENGGPANLISMVKEPTMENVQALFHHKKVSLIAATGGPALVKAAFTVGKKIVAAGPGNPPVLVDETACLSSAARHIIDGASFDNNILCIAEKETFVVEAVFDKFMQEMEKQGAYRLTSSQIEQLTAKALFKNEKGTIFGTAEYIGKNARVLAQACGLDIPDSVRLLYGEVAANHPFVIAEQMMPFMPVVRVRDFAEGLKESVKAEHRFGHTAMIHSNNLANITAFTKAIDTDIVVVNGPCVSGNGPNAGEGYFSHTIASPTGEGVCTPRDFARVRRLAVYKALQIV
ncbi:MAG: aldehyde dehydrogenase [Deferribacteres bacterium]|nr:aldehyde dehydrogenase [candidate division KSB1 bacterium]MCB9502406.1 aldehyde dehydrogenase [Deferribacteres bacterium]